MTCAALELGPACLDVSGVRAGDANEYQLTLQMDGVPVDLTGLTVTAQARKAALDATALDAVVTMVDEANGVIRIAWPGEDVRTFMAGAKTFKGVWDLQVSDGVNDPNTLLAGKWSAEQDVTR